MVRTFISLPAGIARMPFVKFQLYTFVGSWPWCFALAFAGLKLGETWDRNPVLRHVMHTLDGAVLVTLLVGAVLYGRHRWKDQTR